MIKNFWWPLAFSNEITTTPQTLRRFGKDFVAQRTAQGILFSRTLKNGQTERYDTAERYGWMFAFIGDLPPHERLPIPDLPYIEDTVTYKRTQGNFDWNVHYARALENGVDASHTPFVHGGSFGNPEEPQIEEYETKVTDTACMATIHLKPSPAKGLWGKLYTSKKRDTVVKTVVGWWMPNMSILEVHLPMGTLMIFNAHVPIDDTKTVSKWIGLRTFFKGNWADANAAQRVIKIFNQDKKVVESQRPEILPYDLGAELHVKSDAVQIAFRKVRQTFFDRGWGMYPKGKSALE
ncbi:MAG: aromatic ring-hydroxylating dioxygenase subunit alpha [Anaerolineae bacterium]|nr:aromatic ring-hydroxylating dioxygenase subunit alpha [Anaerolineae bacterium]